MPTARITNNSPTSRIRTYSPTFSKNLAGTVDTDVVRYIVDANDNIGIADITWEAQTFTTTNSFVADQIKIKVSKSGTIGIVTVSIRATSGGAPTGADLISASFDGDALTGAPVWKTVSLGAGISLSANTVYALIVRAPDQASFTLNWFDVLSGTYSGGTATESNDSGSSWAPFTSDFLFEVSSSKINKYGDAPIVNLKNTLPISKIRSNIPTINIRND